MKLPRPVGGREHGSLAFLLAAVSAVGPFCIDAYLPSMNEIADTFGITLVAAQQTLTAYMLPFALMTLWHGAISDAIGRRRMMLIGLAIFTAASIGCALSVNLPMLVAFRALQGMTAGVGMVVGRAVVRDLRDGPDAQRMMSLVSVVFAIAPAIAPVIGGWLHHWYGWRSVFVFMAAFSAAVFAWLWAALPESLPADKRQPFRPGYLVDAYRRVITDVRFLSASVALAAGFAGFFVYVLAAPVFLMKHLHVTETGFFWLFGPLTAGMMIGSWLSGRLAGRLSPARTVTAGMAMIAVAVVANLAMNLLVPPGLPHSIVPLVFYSTGMALATPSLTIMVLDLFPAQRGLAASCQSFVQSSGSSLNASLIVPLIWATPMRLALGQAVLFAFAAIAAAFHLLVRRGLALRQQPALDNDAASV